MVTNKIISVVIGILSFLVIPVQFFSTLILGLFVSLSFGLLLIPISFIWIVVFWGPLLGLSYLFDHVEFLRPLLSVIGIPIAVFGSIYVALMPSMGETESRYAKLVYCETFPYTWRFHIFYTKGLISREDGILDRIFKEVSAAEPLGNFIKQIELRNIEQQK